MPVKLNTNANSNVFTKKLWEKRQSNEYTKINNYSEGMCWGCLSRKEVGATLIDACDDCCARRGADVLLTVVTYRVWGLCMRCGYYKNNIQQINCRLCPSCYNRVSLIHKNLRRTGTTKHDPVWRSLRKRFGKDFVLYDRLGQNIR